jgi:hypothetical protein
MHEFRIGDPCYIEYGSKEDRQRHYGHIVDVWSSGRYVAVKFIGSKNRWPFKSSMVTHAHVDEPNREVITHVLV